MNGNTICSIEGNIGSGKTTLITELASKLYDVPVVFIPEPVKVWGTFKDSDGKTVIERFYADREKFAFSFQMMAYISRLEMIKHAVENNKDTIIITERSLYTDKHVFEKMLYEDGSINSIEHQIYSRWFDTFNEYTKLNKLVYVGTSPEKAYERVAKRSRDGESALSLEYLQSCHAYHQEWILEFGCPTLILDGNTDNEADNAQMNYLISKVTSFLDIHIKERDDSPDVSVSAQWLTGC